MAQMYSWLTTLYGNSDDFNWSQFGLPTDKVGVHVFNFLTSTFFSPVRSGRPHHHGPDRGCLQGGQVCQRLLHQRRAVDASYKDLILNL